MTLAADEAIDHSPLEVAGLACGLPEPVLPNWSLLLVDAVAMNVIKEQSCLHVHHCGDLLRLLLRDGPGWINVVFLVECEQVLHMGALLRHCYC